MKYYSEEEKEFIEWYKIESDNFVTVGDTEIDRLQAIIRSDLKRHSEQYTEVSFDVNSNDLALFKNRAERLGIPYKSLLAFLLHKHATTMGYSKSSD